MSWIPESEVPIRESGIVFQQGTDEALARGRRLGEADAIVWRRLLRKRTDESLKNALYSDLAGFRLKAANVQRALLWLHMMFFDWTTLRITDLLSNPFFYELWSSPDGDALGTAYEKGVIRPAMFNRCAAEAAALMTNKHNPTAHFLKSDTDLCSHANMIDRARTIPATIDFGQQKQLFNDNMVKATSRIVEKGLVEGAQTEAYTILPGFGPVESFLTWLKSPGLKSNQDIHTYVENADNGIQEFIGWKIKLLSHTMQQLALHQLMKAFRKDHSEKHDYLTVFSHSSILDPYVEQVMSEVADEAKGKIAPRELHKCELDVSFEEIASLPLASVLKIRDQCGFLRLRLSDLRRKPKQKVTEDDCVGLEEALTDWNGNLKNFVGKEDAEGKSKALLIFLGYEGSIAAGLVGASGDDVWSQTMRYVLFTVCEGASRLAVYMASRYGGHTDRLEMYSPLTGDHKLPGR